MNDNCISIIKKFEFLEKKGFKCEIITPDGFVYVEYKLKNLYLGIGTDYREERCFFSIVIPTGEEAIGNPYSKSKKFMIPEVKDIFDFDVIGTPEEREKLLSLENTMENFENILNEYAQYVQTHLAEIIKLAK